MYNFFIINIKKTLLPFLFCSFILGLIIFSNSNLFAAKSGLLLWANSVIPSLFPFFIATELLSYTNIPFLLGNLFNKIMRPFFNVPGIGAFPLIMGVISGYPTGAKIVCDLRKKTLISKEEGERLLTFTNNSGPLFIIGTVGISLFGDARTGVLLFVTHILSCISTGVIFRFWKRKEKKSMHSESIKHNKSYKLKVSNLGEILSTSITNAINTMLLIGGFVVLFSVIISILKQSSILKLLSIIANPIFNFLNIPTNFSLSFLSGIVEITNGIKEIAFIQTKAISFNIILCSFLLGFGGISILLQVFSITSKSDISILPYILGKFLQGIFAAIYTYLILSYTSFFNLDLAAISQII